MAAVVAGTGLAVSAPFVTDALGFHPLLSMATGGMAAVAMSRVIGESAIRYYGQPQETSEIAASALRLNRKEVLKWCYEET
jgi:hypothetical protein